MSENTNAVEMHGCLVCARIFSLFVVYAPDGSLVGCTVNNLDGHVVPDERQPLVACNTHSVEKIETAYRKWQERRWQARNDDESDNEHEHEDEDEDE